MARIFFHCVVALATVGYVQSCLGGDGELIVTAKNNLEIARPSGTIELAWQGLRKSLPPLHPQRVRVTDESAGTELLWQVVDNDGDGSPDQLIFQSDFEPGETKTFLVEASPDWRARQDSLVHAAYYDLREVARHGKVVDEDDFAWENDRIAFRLYGPTTAKLPFSSSGVDVWVKRVPYLILDKWHYSVKTFHKDYGEGVDFHSVGESRGCGGTGIWKDGKLHVSGNFSRYEVIANGPVRLVFDVSYPPWDVAGVRVSAVKRISLDAGHDLSRHEITFECDGAEEMTYAVGLGKFEDANLSSSRENAWMGLWGPVNTEPELNGEFGLGVIVDGSQLVDFVSTDRPWKYAKTPGNHLAIVRMKAGTPAVHYAGAGWAKGGRFSSTRDWSTYLDHFSQQVRSPLEISVAANR